MRLVWSWRPQEITTASVAKLLYDAGLYVSVVNAKLVHDYGNNELRRVKTDRKDAVKLANYGLDRWLTLPKLSREEDPTAAEELLPPVPAVFQGANCSEEQFDLAAGYGVSKRQPPVFKPDPWGRE